MAIQHLSRSRRRAAESQGIVLSAEWSVPPSISYQFGYARLRRAIQSGDRKRVLDHSRVADRQENPARKRQTAIQCGNQAVFQTEAEAGGGGRGRASAA